MEIDVTLYQATNENVVAGFETEGQGGVEIVTKAAPIIRKLTVGKTIGDAVRALTDRGYDVEQVT